GAANSLAGPPGERRGRKRRAHDPVLLAQVRGRVALARARPPRPADVEEGHPFGLRLLEPVPEGAPGAHVLRLLLGPHELAEVRIGPDPRSRLLDRERVELLDARHRNGRRALAVLVADDVVVDLALAEHEPRHLLAVGRCIVEHWPELAA